jgi:hypothetical protein
MLRKVSSNRGSSNIARDRKSSVNIRLIRLRRSNITQQHHPIMAGSLSAIGAFCPGGRSILRSMLPFS